MRDIGYVFFKLFIYMDDWVYVDPLYVRVGLFLHPIRRKIRVIEGNAKCLHLKSDLYFAAAVYLPLLS
jgi:hypothetical protein